ncbi:MAG: 2'-5' RNA ligase family protein [Sedimentisphaerales bacterium]|jgi:2'-5' RNA ligase|nr:2'-5' RNA ligase family protein [Sedimentisphaerales bacterium]
MGQIAVDIVLLPPREVMDLVIEQNRDLVAGRHREIVLTHDGALPHISLVMGCMETDTLPELVSIMNDLVKDHPPGGLTAIGIAIISNQVGKKVSSLLIHKTDPLQRLHEVLLIATGPLLGYQPRPEMFYGGAPVTQSTLDWVRLFREQSSLHRFWPHITIGYGVARPIDRPVSFHPQALAVCQLGNHCTCQRVLAEVRFGQA